MRETEMTSGHASLIKLGSALGLLAQAKTIQEVKHVSDLAEAARVYAKQSHLSIEIVNDASEIRLRAERRLGEMLKVAPKNPGSRKKAGDSKMESPVPKLSSIGISLKQSYFAQKVASVPQRNFEKFIADGRQDGRELRTWELTRKVIQEDRRKRREERLRDLSKTSQGLSGTLGVFPILYADPPWRYEYIATDSRAIENQYPTMDLEKIKALPIADISAPDAVLFLWATSPKLEEALEVMRSWGFKYRTSAVWDKEKIGMGYYFRQQHEFLLLGTKGDPPTPPEEARPPSVFRAGRLKHSEKPEDVRKAIETMYPSLPRVELFARTKHSGWEVWGNEA